MNQHHYYVLTAVATMVDGSTQPFYAPTTALPTNEAELDALLMSEASITMAENGNDNELEYCSLFYMPHTVPGIVTCGDAYAFNTEEGIEGCMPQATLEAAEAEMQKYSDWLCGVDSAEFDIAAQRAAWESPEHQAYLDSLCRHVDA